LTHAALAPGTPQIFDAYCSKKSLTRDNVRFLFDGQRINPTSSPLDVRALAQNPRARRAASALARSLARGHSGC
jgi:hypothetical protein